MEEKKKAEEKYAIDRNLSEAEKKADDSTNNMLRMLE